MNKNSLIAILVVVLIAVVGFYMYNKGQNEATFGQKAGNTVSEAVEEVKDEVDDHTTSR